MLKLESILGEANEPALAPRLHELGHANAVELLHVEERDLGRRRLRTATDAGTECAVLLPRKQRLFDGAVLYLDGRRAIVVRVGQPAWLRVRPRDAGVALRLGYAAGNLHWRVRFDGTDLLVALEHGDAEPYRARLEPLFEERAIELIDPRSSTHA